MGRAEIVRPYLEKILKEFFEIDELIVDEDGEWPFRRGTALFYVRLLESDSPIVQIYSPFLRGAKKNTKLLEAINNINGKIHFARVLLEDSTVVAATELMAETLDEQEFANAVSVVSGVADHFDSQLQAEFGGETAFAEEESLNADSGDV